MTVARLLIDPPSNATWNMALDQALLDSTSKTQVPCLRFYSWENPTLTLGYFQKSALRTGHIESQKLNMVRRSTGGGAIIHHHEWTYSIAIPENQLPSNENIALYHLLHDSVVTYLCSLGLNAEKFDPENEVQIPATDPKAFLCFQRRTEGDVVLYDRTSPEPEMGNKVLGSAQRKRGGTILQHGSILLAQSPYAPQLPGIEDHGVSLKGRNLEFQSHLIKDLQTQLNLQFEESTITRAEKDGAEHLRRKSFENDAWNLK